MWFSTLAIPGAAPAVRAASSFSAHELTFPYKLTLSSEISTLMRRASTSALRLFLESPVNRDSQRYPAVSDSHTDPFIRDGHVGPNCVHRIIGDFGIGATRMEVSLLCRSRPL